MKNSAALIWMLLLFAGIAQADTEAASCDQTTATSADGKWQAIANATPHTLTILQADDHSVTKVIEVTGGDGAPSRIAGVYDNPLRESFILTLTDAPKIWEVFYGAHPPEFGFAHDWRVEGPVPQNTAFPIRRITIPDMLDNLGFDPSYEYVLGASRHGGGMVIDLVIGHEVANFDQLDNPQFCKGVIRKQGDGYVMEIPQSSGAVLIDMKTWKVTKLANP